MATSSKKIEANRANGKKSKGPLKPSSSRYNAEKHGLLSKGITELDTAENYVKMVRDLKREKNPVGTVETHLVEAVAFEIVGCARARRAEAEYITGVLNPPQREENLLGDLDFQFHGAILDPGIPAALSLASVQEVVKTFQRYQSAHANRLFRAMHEFEREQRMRRGESLPAPIAVDVSVCAETGPLGSVSSNDLPNDDVSSPVPVTLDADVQAPTESEQEKIPPTESEAPQAMLCKAASQRESVTLDGDVQDEENLARPAVDVADIGSGSVNKPPVAWRPPVKSGPIWSR